MRGQIQILNHNNIPIYFILPGEYIILGRGRNADVVLENDSALSRLHCKISHYNQEFWIEDLKSRNRTMVNNKSITKKKLSHQDHIRIGRYRLEFTIDTAVVEEQEDEEKTFGRLRRQDKLMGKVAVEMGLISQYAIRKCLILQEKLTAEGPYIDLEQILLEEKCLTQKQLDSVHKHIKEIPFVIEGYKLLELIGFGGMGRIYKARELTSSDIVAIKILSENRAQMGQQFLREAKAIANLNHPNIVAGLDFGTSNDSVYIVMEYVDGPTLRALVKDHGERLLPDKALSMVIQIAHALKYVHEKGLIHRDIKPENVLVTLEDVAKLCDFGLVKEAGSLETSEQVFGTPAYMSPEQCSSKKQIDIRSDIYSLGVLFYKILFGRLPFIGSAREIRKQHLTKNIKFPTIGNHYEKRELAKVIKKMMAKARRERYQTPLELLESLEGLQKQFAKLEFPDIAGTEEVRITKTRSKTMALDATEMRLVRASSQTTVHPLDATETRPMPFDQTKLANLTQKIRYDDLFRKQMAHRGVVAVLLFAIILLVGYWSSGETAQKKDYKKLLLDISTSEYSKALFLYRQYTKKYPDSETSELQTKLDQKRQKIMQELYKQAKKAYQYNHFLEASNICLQILKTATDRDKIVEEVEQLQRQIKYQKKKLEIQKRYWKTWQEVDQFIGQKKFASAQKSADKLKSLISNGDQRGAYKRLLKKLTAAIKRAKLASFRFIAAVDLHLKKQKEKTTLVQKVKILPGWQKPVIRNIKRPVAGAFICVFKGHIYCINASDGRIRWFHSLDSNNGLFFALSGTRIVNDMTLAERIVVCGSKVLQMISFVSGKILWKTVLPAKRSAPFLWHNNSIFIPTENNLCYKLNGITGKVFGAFQVGGKLQVQPAVSQKLLYLYSSDKHLYVFHLANGPLKSRSKRKWPIKKIMFFLPYRLEFSNTKVTWLSIYKQNELFKTHEISGQLLDFPKLRNNAITLKTDRYLGLIYFEKNALFPLLTLFLDQDSSLAQSLKENKIIAVGKKVKQFHYSSNKITPDKKSPSFLPGKVSVLPQYSDDVYFFISDSKASGVTLSALEGSDWTVLWQRQLGASINKGIIVNNKIIWLSGRDGSIYRLTPQINLSFEQSMSKGRVFGNVATSLVSIPNKKLVLVLKDFSNSQMLTSYSGKKIKRWKAMRNLISGVSLYRNRFYFLAQKNRVSMYSLKRPSRAIVSYLLKKGTFATAPIFLKGSLFVGDDKGNLLRLRIRKSKKRLKIRPVWKYDTNSVVYSSPLVTTKGVYIGNHQGNIYCVHPVRGKLLWKKSTKGAIYSKPLLLKKRLYVGNSAGEVFCLSIKGKIIWKQQIEGQVKLTPIIIAKKTYIVAGNNLYALKQEGGAILWKASLEKSATTFFAAKRKLYIGTDSGFFYMVPLKPN